MRLKRLTLLFCVLLPALACGARGGGAGDANAPRATPTPAAAGAAAQVPRSATCALLSDAEVKEAQGEAPTDAQGSEHLAGGLSMSQCLYRLPTLNRSVDLEVVRAAPDAPADALKRYWRARFHPEAVEARERERERKEERERERERMLERERAAGQTREGGHRDREEEEGEEAGDERPQRVRGLGEEAYLTGNRNTATLHVLRRDLVVRVSFGAPEDRPARLKTATALAQKVLKRL
ncbi:MAG TPA: hypothetical protein VF736_02615 [Pyrinomonadaceae bacterium]|jgi:hypothetical protein